MANKGTEETIFSPSFPCSHAIDACRRLPYVHGMDKACPFCSLPPERVVADHDEVVVIRDGFPVSPGHTLIVLKRHAASFFDTTNEERQAILQALDRAKAALDAEFKPDGYNIGVNDGPPAGQTVPHLHIHLIPRYRGDQSDPRGGMRWIFPDKAKYWDD